MNSIFEAFHRAENNFFSIMSRHKIDYDNIIAFATGVKAPNLNPAIVNEVTDRFQISLNKCKSFYTTQQLIWSLILPQYLSCPEVEHLLGSYGLNLSDEGVAMSLSLDDFQPYNLNPALEVKSMEHDLATWSIPLIYGFESLPEITSVYTKQHQRAVANHANIHHFSGFINDAVVCSLSVSICQGIARLDDIATMPSYQKQGYATTLIYAALKQAEQSNIKTCFLEASASRLSLYKKIGFQELFKNHYYEIIN